MIQAISSLYSKIIYPIRDLIFHTIGLISPKALASIHYKRGFGKKLNWKNPIDINEKINWLKFKSDTSKWTLLADKYKVREYVKSCGLDEMLVDLYGRWDKAEDIDWNSLPNKFVLKTNNGSGNVLICKDKSKLDIKENITYFNKLLKKKFGNIMSEPHYNKIRPCIIAEELLDNTKQVTESSSLIDYKIWSFNGKPAYIWTCYNRTQHSAEVGLYDLEWNFHPEYSISKPHYILGHPIPKPKTLDKMLKAAAILSKGFPEVRIDLYETGGKVYFGEMTFTSAAGFNDFYTDDFLKILGKLTVIK